MMRQSMRLRADEIERSAPPSASRAGQIERSAPPSALHLGVAARLVTVAAILAVLWLVVAWGLA